jgi:DNA-nicking Smr family endonuclease
MGIKSLDLHGTRHMDVFRKVDMFIGESVIKGFNEVEIITGYSQEMKSLVNTVLDDYGLESEEDFLNKGKLIIKLI